ncbi:MAG TPA: hypothetical protein PLL19_12805 [Thiobacillaceae bacterium]|nr:hypothetical protein [Thiobacillaceae bacterium]HNF90207.1 hypothetical protein [Thiobacillaceae bacterium]HNI08307.1 hypothetical protein [Thiobacillaceae bacterium]
METKSTDTDLIAGLREHLACHLQTGRPRSALLARMLLDRLATETSSDTLRERSQQLREVLEERGEAPQARSPSPRRPAWECLGGAP